MITEDYVSFEIAKLLNEKGFDGECNYYYPEDGGEMQQLLLDELYYHNEDFIKCPTHQMAMKYLREVHKVLFCVHPDYPISKDYMVEFYDEGRPSGCFGNYPTYEEAVEAALKYSLENLI